MLLAWIGGAGASEMIPCIAMGFLFMALGRNFISWGKSLPSLIPEDNSAAAMEDRAAARRMILQAVRVGGIILLLAASIVGLLLFFSMDGK